MARVTKSDGVDALSPSRNRPLRRSKTAMVVAQKLVGEISDNDYPAGTKLPPEREMLETFEVGRGTLRESLRFLEMNGVITVKPGPGGGPVVGMPNAHDLASTLGLFLDLRRTNFGAILEVRQVLEPAVAGMAAQRQDKASIAALLDSVQAMNDNVDDLAAFLRENERFHHMVAAAANNPVFSLLLGSLDSIADGARIGIHFPLERRRAVAKAHERIADAIARGDAVAATAEMSSHVDAFRRYVKKHHPDAETSRIRWSDVAP
jgi:GntR family transcriptional repressor for pyruvate dehydrogenase complex